MSTNGQLPEATADGRVLRWPERVVTAEALERRLNGHHELLLPAKAVLTPAAVEHLRERAVRITRQSEQVAQAEPTARAWGYAQDRPYPLVGSAVQTLRRDGLSWKDLTLAGSEPPCQWARAVAECVARGDCRGGVVFCQDPGLVCCVANKVAGLRAAAAHTIDAAARATLTLGANLLIVEMPGRTFFEVRQILRIVCQPGQPACPPGVACALAELDGHAHR
jgi:ribose 5-phosphate isomerase RpiB